MARCYRARTMPPTDSVLGAAARRGLGCRLPTRHFAPPARQRSVPIRVREHRALRAARLLAIRQRFVSP